MTERANRDPTRVVVRTATGRDIEDIVGLHAILEDLQRPWRIFAEREDPISAARMRFRAAITDPEVRVAVAEVAGRVVAMGVARIAAVSTSSDERSLDLSNVVVLPEVRGRGIGRAIVRDLVAFGRVRGVRLVSLRVFSPNEDAAAFWSSLGLRPRFVQMVGDIGDL